MYTKLESNSDAVVLGGLGSVAGVSRSVTLVVAYIMTVTGRGWVESLAAVRAARPCAGPNLGFLRQLEEFENTELREVSCQPSGAFSFMPR